MLSLLTTYHFVIGICVQKINGHSALTIFRVASFSSHNSHSSTRSHILVTCMATVIDWRTLGSHFSMMDSEVEVVTLNCEGSCPSGAEGVINYTEIKTG